MEDSNEHRSCCRMWRSYVFLISRQFRESSANSLTWDITWSGKSFMWHRNSKAPSRVHCGTPEMTGTSCDSMPSNTILIWRHVKKLVIQAWRVLLMPYLSSLYCIFLCCTVVNALEKGSIRASTRCLCHRPSVERWMQVAAVFHRSNLIGSND